MEWLIPYKIDDDEPATGAPAAEVAQSSAEAMRAAPVRAAPSAWAWVCSWALNSRAAPASQTHAG